MVLANHSVVIYQHDINYNTVTPNLLGVTVYLGL